MANTWYRRAALLAWKTDPDWQFDDSNIGAGESNQSWTYDATFAGLPRATRTLTDDTAIYRLPTNALSIERVEVLDTNGDYYPLKPIEEAKIEMVLGSNVAVSEFFDTKGKPRYYNLVGSNVELFPAPDSGEVTTTAGIKIYVSRDVKRIDSEDDSTEPSLPTPFHRILSLGASYDIAVAKGLDSATRLKNELNELFLEMEGYYASRNRHNKKSIKPRYKSFI